MGRTPVLLVAIILSFVVAVPSIPSPISTPDQEEPIGGGHAIDTPANLSLPHGQFTENIGQFPDRDILLYLSSGNAFVGFSTGGVLFNLSEQSDQTAAVISPPDYGMRAMPEPSAETRSTIVRISFGGANLAMPEGRGELSYRSNYFLGNDPSRWRTGVREYREIVYENLYDGIDLVYSVSAGHLKYDIFVSPGADSRLIDIKYEGVDALALSLDGSLLIRTPAGDLRDTSPIARQRETAVPCSFAIRTATSYGFACSGFDPNLPLDIDPLIYATYLGDSGVDLPWGVTSDAAGNAYITGHGRRDAYVAKLSPDGASFDFVTYFGGSDEDSANKAVVDDAGNIYLTGTTFSSDFPATPGAYDRTYGGSLDAFVAELDSTGGTLRWATYLGGSQSENGYVVALDSGGNVYACGWTFSPDFPVTFGAFQNIIGGGATGDGYITKLNPSGSALVYSTFLGGNNSDTVWDVLVDAAGDAYAIGNTNSTDFPTTPGALSRFMRGSSDAFVVELDPAGGALLYGTYIGGGGGDWGGTACLDTVDNLYVAGRTESTDFTVTPGAYDNTLGGSSDSFLIKLNMSAKNLVYATYIGGSAWEEGGYIGIDAGGDAFVSGSTISTDFPVTPDAVQSTLGGPRDAFLAVLSPTGGRLQYGTYIGGSAVDIAYDSTADAAGNAYLVGLTLSADFPITAGVVDSTYGGSGDVWAARLGPPAIVNTPPVLSWTGEPSYISDGLNPETGTTVTNFSYRVAYSDADYQLPSQIDVKVEKPLGTTYGIFPLTFARWVGPPGNYSVGAIYAFNTTLPAGTDWWYSFLATDGWAWATGPPTIAIDAPDIVADNPPVAVANASPTSAFIGDTITFDATGSTDDFGITSYLWDFGDTATDTNPVTTHVYSTRCTFPATLTVWDTAGQNDTDTVFISIGNRRPIADAGPDQSVFKNDSVTLDGTGSSDPDGDSLTYQWSQTAGLLVALVGADTATPSFSPAASGTYAFLLTVGDGWGGSSNDTVNVTVVNRAPAADAGLDRTVSKKSLVALDGTGSSDPDGDKLAFAWTQTGGPSVFLTDADTANPTFTPPRSGTYVFQLTVDDGDGGTSSDTVQVTATNAQPVADAGPDRSAQKNTPVTLDGSSSSDPDGDTLTFSWTQLSGPVVTLTGADTAAPSFTPTKAGMYAFRLRLGDGDGGASEDTTNVTVWGLPPVAHLVAIPPSAYVDSEIAFHGNDSADPDGTIVDYAFDFGDGSTANGTASQIGHAYARAGSFNVTLTVTDDDGNTSTARIGVTIDEPSEETNWKPLVALVFAIVLMVVGVWSSRRRPWKGGKDGTAGARAFMITSMPFVLAEAVTGIVSFATGQLSIPPTIGPGTAVDAAILLAGLGTAIARALKTSRPNMETTDGA